MSGGRPVGVLLALLVLLATHQVTADTGAGAPTTAPAPTAPRGVVVVALDHESVAPAKALARLVYADAWLRPSIDEATARVLAGEPVAPTEAARLRELSAVMGAIKAACTTSCQRSVVAKRLLASLGQEQRAELVVLVEAAGGGPTARVLHVAEQRWAPVVLSGELRSGPKGAYTRWIDAGRVLRGLLSGPPAGAAAPAIGVGSDATVAAIVGPISAALTTAEAEDEGIDVLESPWFWAGVGVLVVAGITIFALAQSDVSDPETVHVQGRVSQ